MNIRVDLNTPINDGTEVVFRSPVDCSQVTGLIVYYDGGSQEFAFADAHGNNVGDIDHLFAEDVVVKVILDVTTSMAFVQNADTNAYLEGRFDEKADIRGSWSASYKITGAGKRSKWCRIANICRVINGTLNLDLFQGAPCYMVQNVSLDISGYVKWGGDSKPANPVIVQKYNNIYGVDEVINNPLKQSRINKIRIAYPKRDADYGEEGKFPIPNDEGKYQSINNPVYCYVDALIEYDSDESDSATPILYVNFNGMAASHCKPITEQTVVDDSTVGTYGEQLDFCEFELNPNIDFYMPERKMQVKEIYAENLNKRYELIEKITLDKAVSRIVRTTDNSGRPYNFSDVRMQIMTPKATISNVYIDVRGADGARLAYLQIPDAIGSTQSNVFFKLHDDKGFPEYYAFMGGSGYTDVFRGHSGFGKVWNGVCDITLTAEVEFPVGTTITIYGVWSD